MDTPSLPPLSQVALWDSGRLAVSSPGRRPFGRDEWIAASLLVVVACLFIAYVAVLQSAVQRSEMSHSALRAAAVAEAECESSRPVDQRGACLALFDGATSPAVASAADVTPTNAVYEGGWHVSTVAAMSGAQ